VGAGGRFYSGKNYSKEGSGDYEFLGEEPRAKKDGRKGKGARFGEGQKTCLRTILGFPCRYQKMQGKKDILIAGSRRRAMLKKELGKFVVLRRYESAAN